MIIDSRYARRYLRTFTLDPKINKAMAEAGIMIKGDTIGELARRLGMESQRLGATVERFNGFARAGIDGDFDRGNSASVMGRTYPGPGSTIGPAVVFGTRAARHMARARVS